MNMDRRDVQNPCNMFASCSVSASALSFALLPPDRRAIRWELAFNSAGHLMIKPPMAIAWPVLNPSLESVQRFARPQSRPDCRRRMPP
jgi:hypothetical protein